MLPGYPSGSISPPYEPHVHTSSSPKKRPHHELNYDGSTEQKIAKKSRISVDTPASRVLHVRSLPPDCTDQELIGIAYPFGIVDEIMLLKTKNQAFVQMRELTSAISLIQYYTQVQANIRGKPVYFQFSERSEITPPERSSKDSLSVEPNSILLVNVLHLLYPITIEILHEIFSKYGTLRKIIIFSKKGFNSLIQFSKLENAQEAKAALDGQSIYSGCCTLRIQYSSFDNLNVKYNNDKTRDFTNPSLPPGSSNPPPNSPPYPEPLSAPYPDPWNVERYPSHHPHRSPSRLPPYSSQPSHSPHSPPSSRSQHSPISPRSYRPSNATPVLIVSNLEAKEISPYSLFTLFGVFGDVVRVKILYNKLDTALIQFVDSYQAETAMVHLNQIPFHGKNLTINFSKHVTVSMPKDSEGMHLTKDFSGSPLHRYKVSGSKNYQHICPPSSILHLSNLPVNLKEQDVRRLFERHGTVLGFKFFRKDKHMALIEMESVSEAVIALVSLHNYQIGESSMRVSFSKARMV